MVRAESAIANGRPFGNGNVNSRPDSGRIGRFHDNGNCVGIGNCKRDANTNTDRVSSRISKGRAKNAACDCRARGVRRERTTSSQRERILHFA
jgi:hypothetical protein